MYRTLISASWLLALFGQSQGQLSTSPDLKHCDIDGCRFATVQNQKELGRNRVGRLLELDLLKGEADFDEATGKLSEAIDWYDRPGKVWVFCSSLYPAVMIEEPPGLHVTILDFGDFGVGSSYLSHAKVLLYACNLIRSSEPTSKITRQLGYRERPNDSQEIEALVKKPADILELTKDKMPR